MPSPSIDKPTDVGFEVLSGIFRAVEIQPGDQTAITGLTAKMLGLGAEVTFTPRRSGTLEIHITGDITCNTTAKTVSILPRYGTGTAPANDAALTGTAFGITRNFTALTGMLTVPYALSTIVSGLRPGVAHWFDFGANTDDALATGRVLTLVYVIKELS